MLEIYYRLTNAAALEIRNCNVCTLEHHIPVCFLLLSLQPTALLYITHFQGAGAMSLQGSYS
jgi:hypothetical protein